MYMYVVDALQFYKLKLLTKNSKGVLRRDFKGRFIIGKMTKIRPVLKVWKVMNQSYMYVYYVYNWQDWSPFRVCTIAYFVALKRWQSFSTRLSHWRSFWIKENRYLKTISMPIIILWRTGLSLITCMIVWKEK